MLKYFRKRDLALIFVVVIFSHAIVMSLFHELIGVSAIFSSILSFVGTIFAIYMLRSKMDINLEVKPKKRPL